MTVISIFVILIHLFLSCRNLAYGLACFLAVRVLIPEMVRSPVPSLSLNSFLILVLFIVALLKGKLNFNIIVKDSFGRFLIFFIGLQLLALPFSEYLNLSLQFSAWLQFLFTDIFPALLAICLIKSETDLNIIIKCMIFTLLISLFYGLYTFVIKDNPWCDYVESYYPRYNVHGDVFESFDYSQRKSSKSTFISHNGFGYYLTYMLAFLFMLKNKLSSRFFIFSFAFIVLNMIFSTKRSPIVVLMFMILFFVWHKKKLIVPLSVCIIAFFVALFSIPALDDAKNYFMTAIFFWDDSYARTLDVGGSNMELRIRQVLYPFIEIKDNLLLGHGFGWCSTYLSINQNIHPILYGFETILSTVICQSGILGIVLYLLLFIRSYKYIRHFVIDNKINYALLFVLSIVLLYIATGIQYMYYFFLILVVLNKSTKIDGYINKRIKVCPKFL